MGTDQHGDGDRHRSRRTWRVSMTIRARQLVEYCLLMTVFLALSGVGAALAADTMVLHIPSQTMTLPNGLTVVVSPRDKLPVAAISVRFKVGSAYDPEDKAGLADMTARLLDKGTTTRTATAIAEELDFLGPASMPVPVAQEAPCHCRCWPRISTVACICSSTSCMIPTLRRQS